VNKIEILKEINKEICIFLTTFTKITRKKCLLLLSLATMSSNQSGPEISGPNGRGKHADIVPLQSVIYFTKWYNICVMWLCRTSWLDLDKCDHSIAIV